MKIVWFIIISVTTTIVNSNHNELKGNGYQKLNVSCLPINSQYNDETIIDDLTFCSSVESNKAVKDHIVTLEIKNANFFNINCNWNEFHLNKSYQSTMFETIRNLTACDDQQPFLSSFIKFSDCTLVDYVLVNFLNDFYQEIPLPLQITINFQANSVTQTLPDRIFNDNIIGHPLLLKLKLKNVKLSTKSDIINLTELQSLTLNQNSIEEIKYDFMRNFPELIELMVSLNPITKIDIGTFLSQAKLFRLVLVNNSISELYEDSLQGLSDLQNLNLMGNQLRKVHEKCLKHSPKLFSLFLDHNLLDSLPARLFANLKGLVILSIRNNSLKSLPENLLINLERLQQVDLSGNKLTTIPDYLFLNSPLVNILWVEFNKLSTISG